MAPRPRQISKIASPVMMPPIQPVRGSAATLISTESSELILRYTLDVTNWAGMGRGTLMTSISAISVMRTRIRPESASADTATGGMVAASNAELLNRR